MKKIELLAPAGSFEKAKIAIKYGADAIYCGTPELSLRSRSELEEDDLEKTINYAHEHGKKVHVAVNIYAGDETYEKIIEEAKKLERLRADAVIIADGGVIDVFREYAPNVDIHVSTQANTVSYHTCKFWHRNGAKRIVLSRELNKKQIEDIIKNKPDDLEIETFVHGAICFAYSGRCFLSEFLAGRNANLGDCAQSCRWTYNVYVEETNNPGNLMPVETDEKGTYIFSSKDLCLVNELPELIQMGVDSLKVEGRLKTEYYIATVINTYRAAIDDYYNNPQNYDGSIYMEELEKTKTRGLTTFYFNDKNNKDFQDYKGRQYNSDYEFGGMILKELKEGRVLIEIRNKLSVGDSLELIIPGVLKPLEFKIEKLWDDETLEEIETVNPGKYGQKVILNIPSKVEEGWIIRRKK